MAKIFENSQLVNKLSQDDPECAYVNRMMEMSADFLRELNRNGECYDSMHGVVPTYKLPSGYSFGNIDTICKDRTDKAYEKADNKNGINANSQNSSNSNSTLRMESDEHDNETNQTDEKMKMIETVRKDLILSDEDEDHDNDVTPVKTSTSDRIEDNERLLFETLNACSQKLPVQNSMNLFQKHYKSNNADSAVISGNKIKKDLPGNSSGEFFEETEETKNCRRHVIELLDLISKVSYKKNLTPSFQKICNIVNGNKRKSSQQKCDEKSVSPQKLLKISKADEKKKVDNLDSQYRIYSTQSVLELSMNIIPDFTKDFNFDKMRHVIKNTVEVPKEQIFQATTSNVSNKTKYVTQDSLPFDSQSKKDINAIEENIINPMPQSLLSNHPIENFSNPVKKPEAAAKQFYAQSTNYSNYNVNAKVAVITGKVNKTQSTWQNKTDTNNKPSLQINSQSSYQRQNQNQASQSNAYKDNNDNDADESKVVEGLAAMNKMRTYFKNDFITRMRNLEIEKWLKEVRSLKEKAIQCKGQLDYAPQIMVFIRKNLFYNYSLEVKSDYAKSHHTYLENATIIKQSCSDIIQIYNEHEKNMIDKNSTRLWNIKLVKHFTVIMCHRLSAILQYRAFRNVAEDCRKIHETLVRSGVIDKNDRTNPLVVESHHHHHNHHSSPFSVLSSYSPGQVSTRNSSPRLCNSGNHSTLLSSVSNNGVTLTPEIKAKLQRYIDHTNIINASYNDWMLAEKYHVLYCNRSARHEESWRDFEWKIIEKTGGVVISSIDESIPFVIKYLEGYINYMNEFMKHGL